MRWLARELCSNDKADSVEQVRYLLETQLLNIGLSERAYFQLIYDTVNLKRSLCPLACIPKAYTFF